MELTILKRAMRDAAAMEVPLIGDVYQHMYGPPEIVVWHYDFLHDLSSTEIAFFDGILRRAASIEGMDLHKGPNALSYTLSA